MGGQENVQNEQSLGMVAIFCREIRDSYRDNFRKLSQKFEVSRKFYLDSMVAYFCRKIRDSYRDNFRKLSRKFQVSRKFYQDSKIFSKNISR